MKNPIESFIDDLNCRPLSFIDSDYLYGSCCLIMDGQNFLQFPKNTTVVELLEFVLDEKHKKKFQIGHKPYLDRLKELIVDRSDSHKIQTR